MSDEIPDAQHRKLWGLVMVVGACVIPALGNASGGPELMLKRKLGAKTHGISHRLLLQHLPLLLRTTQLPAREQRQGLAMAASSFMQMLCPDAILTLLWGMCG